MLGRCWRARTATAWTSDAGSQRVCYVELEQMRGEVEAEMAVPRMDTGIRVDPALGAVLGGVGGVGLVGAAPPADEGGGATRATRRAGGVVCPICGADIICLLLLL